MSEMTPGQAACIAWNEHYAEEHGIEARNEWAASDPRGRAAWEAAAKAAQAHLREVPELGAVAYEAAENAPLRAEIVKLRELLDEIGVLAANAPEDGDSFDLLQDIAMRIAAMDVEEGK